MPDVFSLSEGQKKAFEGLLLDKGAVSSQISRQEAAFDAFNALIGSERVLTAIKSMLPATFAGQALFTVDASNTKDVLVALAKFSSRAGYTPVLVLFGSNYKSVSAIIRDYGVTGKCIILDCVSKSIAHVGESEGVFFVDSMRNLTQMQIKILNIIKANPRSAFIFDSLLVLGLYHNEKVVLKFVYSLTKLLRKNAAPSYYIASDKKAAQKFAQFFDESLELKKFF